MNRRWLTLLALVAALLLAPAAVLAQQFFSFSSQDARVEILSPEKFAADFGANPDIPRTDEAVLALAQRLFPSLAAKRAMPQPLEVEPQPPPLEFEPGAPHPPAPGHRCGTPHLGALFAALQNPAISDATRLLVDQIIAESKPPFRPPYKTTHFTIYYTDNNPDTKHNVTLSQVQNTGALLEQYYEKYVTSFTAPKANLPLRVEIYYGGTEWWGLTSCYWNRIELHSEAVRNWCGRRWISAHELFHRVQFSYGYVDGRPKMQWAVEGSAAWAEKFACKSQGIWNYLKHMNEGLNNPDVDLFQYRKYDACYLWVYLAERAGTYLAVKDFWVNYQGNRNGPAALSDVVKTRLKMGLYKFLERWHQANILKDLDGIAARYDYQEDEVQVKSNCGYTWGPLAHVTPSRTRNINDSSNWGILGTVAPGGAKYYVFNLDPKMEAVKIRLEGEETGDFFYNLIFLQGNTPVILDNWPKNCDFYCNTLRLNNFDKLIVVVGGKARGGSYSLAVKPTLFHYQVDFTATFSLSYGDGGDSGTLTGAASGNIPDYYIRYDAYMDSWYAEYSASEASLSYDIYDTYSGGGHSHVHGTWDDGPDAFVVFLGKYYGAEQHTGFVLFNNYCTEHWVWTHPDGSVTEYTYKTINHISSDHFIFDPAKLGTSFSQVVIFHGEPGWTLEEESGQGILTFTLIK